MKPTDSIAHAGERFEEVLSRRLARRTFLKTGLTAAPLLIAGPALLSSEGGPVTARAAASDTDGLRFQPISLNNLDAITVPEGYTSEVVLRWGDPILPKAPEFNFLNQTPEAQSGQFGFNCDFLGFFPLPKPPASNPSSALLVVNHEFTTGENMFLDYVAGSPTRNQVDVELAAHGLAIVEIRRNPSAKQHWKYDRNSRFNRRITGETLIEITGPAAGDDLLKVSYDPTGRSVRGTLNNCGGGKTPWGTVLIAEENFNQYFANLNSLPDSDPRKAIHARYGVTTGASERRWENFHSRFNVAIEPNEPFRFGWVLEIDPFDPAFVPKKRTALGRMKHEAATTVISRAGRAVVYTGDDERFDYMYKFVSDGSVDLSRREANFGLLDEGTLYAARFNDDGTGEWLPLVGGRGPLSQLSQAAVLINARGASDLVGATKMDRPEDLETNPVNGKLYAVFTNNTQRGTGGRPGVNPPNPRANNRHGHIIEITEDGNDAGSTTFRWEILLLCGDPDNASDGTFWAGFDPSQVSPISSPDNITFDSRGNLWIATDGQTGTFGKNDGIYAVPVEGSDRGFLRQFLSGVVGCETASLEFSDDNETLFVSIQHPGEGSRLQASSSTFPDGTIPPRPSVVAVKKVSRGSKAIGS